MIREKPWLYEVADAGGGGDHVAARASDAAFGLAVNQPGEDQLIAVHPSYLTSPMHCIARFVPGIRGAKQHAELQAV